MIEHTSDRARAEARQLSRKLHDVQSANRVEAADAAQQAMEEKTARLRAARLARDAAAGGRPTQASRDVALRGFLGE